MKRFYALALSTDGAMDVLQNISFLWLHLLHTYTIGKISLWALILGSCETVPSVFEPSTALWNVNFFIELHLQSTVGWGVKLLSNCLLLQNKCQQGEHGSKIQTANKLESFPLYR